MLSVAQLNPDDSKAGVGDPGIVIEVFCARDVGGQFNCESVHPNNHFLLHFKIGLILYINVTIKCCSVNTDGTARKVISISYFLYIKLVYQYKLILC